MKFPCFVGNTGSMRYMAPEVVDSMPYNEKVDMYGFGVIMWQVATGIIPYLGFSKSDIMTRVAERGERPDVNMRYKMSDAHPNLPKRLKSLLQDCWCPNMHARMSALDAVNVLSELLIVQAVASPPVRRSCLSRIFSTG